MAASMSTLVSLMVTLLALGSIQMAAACYERGCSIFKPCCSGYSCHPWFQKCYDSPRKEGQPCSAGFGCAGGLNCEAGSQRCRGPAKWGEGCHATRPCGDRLSCQPGSQKCYNSPRKEGEPCSAGFSCEGGLVCEAGTQQCKKKGEVGDACHATRPCKDGLSCQPGVQKCYNSPRKEGQPCVAGFGCESGLNCEAGTQTCKKPGERKESCHATRPCKEGLTCQPGVHKCYDNPRQMGQPCSMGFECADGLYCAAVIQTCLTKEFDVTQKSLCALRYSPILAGLNSLGKKMETFGAVVQGNAGASASAEYGIAFNPDGTFGCYRTTCEGVLTDVGVSVGFAYSGYDKWADIPGKSQVIGGGASLPFIEAGMSGGSIQSEDGKNNIGFTMCLSVGLGIIPAQGSVMKCDTVFNEIKKDEFKMLKIIGPLLTG